MAEEIARVVPFIEASPRRRPRPLISIDTSKSEVAEAALVAGADIVNDVWGAQRDPQMAAVIGRHGAACILMHNRPAEEAGVGDVIEAIRRVFREVGRDRAVRAEGVQRRRDPARSGAGFRQDLCRRIGRSCAVYLNGVDAIGYPLLLGASRKSMIAKLLELADPKARLSGSLATTALAIQAGVDCIRVHDVRENRECARVMDHCLRYE